MHIYLITSGGASSPRCKVGISADPEFRTYTIAQHSPFAVRLESYWRVPKSEARSIERSVHEELKARRSHGEWFKCSGNVARTAILIILRERGIPSRPVPFWEKTHDPVA